MKIASAKIVKSLRRLSITWRSSRSGGARARAGSGGLFQAVAVAACITWPSWVTQVSRMMSSEIERELALLQHQEDERRDVARVHLARVDRDRGGEPDGADDGHVVLHDFLPGVGERAVAAHVGGEIDDHRAWLHLRHRVGGNQLGRGESRHARRRDDHVGLGNPREEEFLRLRARLGRQLLRVAGGVLGLRGGKFGPDERRAQALHLFGGGGTNVVSLDHGACWRAVAIAWPRHARATISTGTGPRSRPRPTREARRGGRGQKNRLVSGDRGHRGKGVHPLRAGGAGSSPC